jgi:hypothetical protein
MLDGTEFYECDCGSDEHTLRFILDLDKRETKNPDPMIYTNVYLNNWEHWYKRVWTAIKYVFGYKCKYGHWDCFILRYEDADRMIAMLTKLKEAKNEKVVKNVAV